MSDDDDKIIVLDAGDADDVLQWAIATAALASLTYHALNNSDNLDYEALADAIEQMYNNMPQVLVGPAWRIALNTVEEIEEDERAIEQFKNELDSL